MEKSKNLNHNYLDDFLRVIRSQGRLNYCYKLKITNFVFLATPVPS